MGKTNRSRRGVAADSQDIADRAWVPSEPELRQAIAATRLGIWQWDVARRQLSWDATMCEIWGVAEHSPPRCHEAYMLTIHPEDRDHVSRALARALDTGRYETLEHRLVRPDGNVRWVVSRASVAFDEQGDAVRLIGGTLDVTEERRADERRREAQKLEAVGELSAGVAHNFNNLLMAILPNLEMLLEDARDEQRELLSIARESAAQAAELVRALMLFAGRSRGRRHTAEDLARVVRRTVDKCRNTFDRSISLRVSGIDEPQLVCGDPSQLEQALLNVLFNARDSVLQAQGCEPSIVVSVSTVMRAVSPGVPATEHACVRVEDNGRGMDAATRVRIFEPFFTTKQRGGTGLGLSTTTTIVREHGGSLDVETAPGRGATFSIFLPRASSGSDRAAASESAHSLGGHELILVVDDDRNVRQVVTTMLRRAGYGVCTASDGREVLRLLAQEPMRRDVALVLLDMSMPGLSGRAVRHELSRLAPGLPVAYFTGYGLDCPEEVDGVIEKPVRPAGLLRSVRAILDRRSREGGSG